MARLGVVGVLGSEHAEHGANRALLTYEVGSDFQRY
jgi:hypothetical protein